MNTKTPQTEKQSGDVIQMSDARAKLEEKRKRQKEEEEKILRAKNPSLHNRTTRIAGESVPMKLKVARGIQIAVMVFAVVYLINVCGLI